MSSQLEAARAWSRALARLACGGVKGRSKLDPFYIDVTQGRDFEANWTHYSSCGDLPHWHASMLGVPLATPWLNREAPAAGKHWQFGTASNGFRDNISMLHAFKGSPGIPCPVGYLPQCGDYLLVWRGDGSGVHALIVGNTTQGACETFNYGAGGMSNSAKPGASCGSSRLSTSGQKLWLGTRIVQRVVPLEHVLAASTALPSMTGEELDALEAGVA